MSRNLKILLVLLGAALFVGYMVYSTLSLRQVRCEVCMVYNGREQCRGAVGVNEDEATATAVRNACSFLASGRDQNIACISTPPASVMCE